MLLISIGCVTKSSTCVSSGIRPMLRYAANVSALSLLDEMRKAGVAPSVYSYSAAISACEKGRQWEDALSLLEEMRTRGVEPSVYSFNAAISACGAGGQWERALSLLEEMHSRGVEPDVISFSAAISACEKGGQWERALSLLDEMRAAGVAPDVISFSAAISACEKAGEWERALALLDEMRARGVELDVIDETAPSGFDTFGERVAGSEREGVWSTPRKYVVAAEHTDAAHVDLRVRVVDTGGEGGFTSAAAAIRLVNAGAGGSDALPLAGTWSRQVRADLKQLPPWPRTDRGPNRPAVLYNGMIAPLLPFPFTGCIWYQGESNRNRPESLVERRTARHGR